MAVKVDKNKCIGCGACESICPATFGMKDGKAFVKKQPSKITCEKDAKDSCPISAISL
jgi:ferredoxin